MPAERPDEPIAVRPAASVVVLAYNAAAVIAGCLESLHGQDFRESFEVIVVWSGDEQVRAIVQGDFPGVRLTGRPERLFTGEARNWGVRAASGQIIAFLAADCRAAPDWLRRRVLAHREGFACVGGVVLRPERAGPIARAAHLLEYSDLILGRPREVVVGRPLYGLSFHREIFSHHGGYVANLASGEDCLFNWQLAKAGERFLFDPAIRIVHPGSSRLGDFLRHQWWHGVWFARLCRRHDYPAFRHRFIPTVALLFLAYPAIRLKRLAGRVLRWRRDLLGELIALGPIVLLGIASVTLGLARGWWERETP